VIKLTHDRLVEVLDYVPDTGWFVWKIRPSNRIHVGDRAGVIGTNGHRFISVDGEKLQASRLAWFYVHKEWPSGDIKQPDGDRGNCALENLRHVDRISAARERGIVSTNSTGFKGVSPSQFGKFQASITWNYQQISLGSNFETAELASAVYQDAESRLIAARANIAPVVAELKLARRQRAAWANLVDQNIPLGWSSFEAFAADIVSVPERRYAIMPIDAAKPIGPDNYRWASDGAHNTGTVEGRRAYAKANRAANKDQHRNKDFIKKYGIDFAEYQRMLVEQKGVCACCERPESRMTDAGELRMLSVDHNHTTNAVRGLLCSNCNLVLGYACDDVTVLQKAIAYLQKHGLPSNVVKFEPSIVTGTMGNGT
jgi:hypothetical protein